MFDPRARGRVRCFRERRHHAPAPSDCWPARPPRGSRSVGPGRGAAAPTALVANYHSDTVTPVALSTRKAVKPIRVGSGPDAIALTPDDRTAYVANSGSGTVTPIDTATHHGRAVRSPLGLTHARSRLVPDGRTAYVVDGDSNEVTPVNTATDQPGPPIPVGAYPRSIALAPDGHTAYVLNWGGASVTPIDSDHWDSPSSNRGRLIPDGDRVLANARQRT